MGRKREKDDIERMMAFAGFIHKGFKKAEAYAKACGREAATRSDSTMAGRWVKEEAVKDEVARLRSLKVSALVLERNTKRELLANIAMDERLSPADRIRAIAEDNKMAGHYEPEEHSVRQVNVYEGVIDLIDGGLNDE